MTNFAEIRCPFCGRWKSVRPQADTFFCTRCFKHFDNDPDEGGDYATDPTKRIERTENRHPKPRR